MRARLLLVVLAACGHPASPHPPDLATRAAPGLASLDADRLVQMTKDLSSDDMEGRAPGSDGGKKAEAYVADQFAALGLEPAGTDGFFQPVPLRQATLISASFTVGDEALDGDGILFRPDAHEADVAIDAPVVLVGYGISEPRLGRDELAGVDFGGAIVVVFGGSPRNVDGKDVDAATHAVLGDWWDRTEVLAAHGASAVIAVYDPVRAERMPWDVYHPKLVGPVYAWLDGDHPGSAPYLPVAIISEATLDQMLAQVQGPAAHDVWSRLDRGEHLDPIALGAGSLRIHSTLRDVTARNVAGLLRGKTDETVLYTAHLDHLGRGPAIDGDDIYNGALDNAIGVAALDEIARAFLTLSPPPRRSILFVAVTGEEAGLLGSDYFARHPTVPLDHIVADLNIDGVNPLYEAHDIVALGSEHSTIAAQADAAAAVLGMSISPDPDPAQVYFIRSDQYSFVKQGIPSVFAGAGLKDANGDTAANQAISDAWGEQHYHRPSDEWRADYHPEWTLPELRFHFLLGLEIADADARPSWNPGDAFGAFAP